MQRLGYNEMVDSGKIYLIGVTKSVKIHQTVEYFHEISYNNNNNQLMKEGL